jgi:cytochrome c heme-lyase
MSPSKDTCPIDHLKEATATCPVDHATWSNIQPHSSDNLSSPTPTPGFLSSSRQVSSIPRSDKDNWVYPSEAQFYAAMARKNHDPKAPDMSVVVPIHNAVNERAWSHIQQWEAGRGGERCGGVRLVSFRGKPGEPSPKARILTLLGCVSLLRTTLRVCPSSLF